MRGSKEKLSIVNYSTDYIVMGMLRKQETQQESEMNTFCVCFFFLSKPVDCINLEKRGFFNKSTQWKSLQGEGKNQHHYQQSIRNMLIKIINIFIWWPTATYNWDSISDLINADFQINAPHTLLKLFYTPFSNERPLSNRCPLSELLQNTRN